MNLYTGKETPNPAGHNTVVNNNIGPVTVSSGQRIGWTIMIIIAVLTIIGGIVLMFVVIQKRNQFRQLQLEINNAASNVDVQLQKRSDTLIKLVDSVKNYISFEKDILTKITELRSGVKKDMNETAQQLNDIQRAININVEQYPDLKSSQLVQTLMNESSYIEREIAAQRRLYNQYVTQFNTSIWVFPWSVTAANMKLETIVLFEASAEAKKDVKISF